MKVFQPSQSKLIPLSNSVIAAYGNITEQDLQWHLELLTAMAAKKGKLSVTKTIKKPKK